MYKMDYIEALADAWASIDGKRADFIRCKIDRDWEDEHGTYGGYLAEAKEITKRLAVRGYKIVPIEEGETK